MRTLPTSSLKSAPVPSVLWQFWGANRALATVSCTFFGPHLPKVARSPQFTSIFWANRALATHVHFFGRRLLDIEARNRGNTDPPLATRSHLWQQHYRTIRSLRLFHPQTYTLLDFYCDLRSIVSTCQLLLLPLWLTWVWHEYKTNHGHSSVTRKLSN